MTIRRWVDNTAQQNLDIAWAKAMFRAGIAFNFLNLDTTMKLHEVYLEVATARPKVKLPSARHIRTVMLNFIFLRIQKQVQPLTACRDVTGCTFITDGLTDRRERPVLNFLAAGEQAAVLVVTVSMDGKKKTGPALARLWEKIMREIGCISVICTDNAEANKKAAQILERRTDPAVSRIPWVPCAAHCCSLLLRDIRKLDWIKGMIKRSHTIVKFIRNHHCTHSLMMSLMSLDNSLSLTRPTEVRFGSVYMMMERLYDRRAILKQMVEGSMVGRWKAMRWSTTKLQSKADLVFFTLRMESWWPELKKVVEVMEPLYNLLRRMDKDGTAPSNLVEYDKLMERMLGEVVLTTEQRDTVLERVRDHMKMMQQPVHALAFLLDPRRREPKWLLDRDSALVQNALNYLQRQIDGPWKSDAHVNILSDLREFHMKPTDHNPRRKDRKMWEEDAIADLHCNQSNGHVEHGNSGGAELVFEDLVHSKRRNRLNPSTLEKLVYIHWNMQLLRSGKNVKDNGYIDLWAQFFESLPEPEADDGSTLNEPVEEKDKTEGRIQKRLEHEDEEEKRTDDSDLDDEVWKGKTPWSEASSEEEVDESSDDDFELGLPPPIPCTTYVGRRAATQRHRERPPATPSQCPANTATQYNIQSDVDLPQTDTDMEMVLHTRPIDTDEEDADRAKAWADADRERVQRRMREEEERRAAIPTRRELEKMKKRVGERESQPVGGAGRLEEDKEDALGQQEGEAEQEIGQPAQEEENMNTQEEEEDDGMDQREEEMKDDGEGVEHQEEDLEESGKEQRQEMMENGEEEEEKNAPTTVYKRRKRTAEAAGSPENSPDFPANNAEAQRDNVWVSRVGRKRKVPREDEQAKPKLPRGWPRKNTTAGPAAKPKKKNTAVQASQKNC
ncbi:hypothetical protein CBR_g26102 [Chara braunii]|uniref:DUF659 domain-containing protein n=1 Tax=Chara braunii TaxID=69332 RepID=A0A388JVU7_CHABU|nr:hypothetical protein CBR_g26102 [Chara braunii]|eukprot:GBG61939.1 hypothetical protein CBR_g26102 [Chara braunii]